MPGIISGAYGAQRSGKTALSYLLAETYRKQGCPVYSNMEVEGWHKIESLTEIPLDYKPKTILLDECYYFLDARNWKDFKETSLFFNTIGKQRINLMFTGIHPDDLELRLRRQHNFMYLVKSDDNYIYYRMIDINRNNKRDFKIRKGQELWNQLKYDSDQVPGYVDMDVSKFLEEKDKLLSKKKTTKTIEIVKRSIQL